MLLGAVEESWGRACGGGNEEGKDGDSPLDRGRRPRADLTLSEQEQQLLQGARCKRRQTDSDRCPVCATCTHFLCEGPCYPFSLPRPCPRPRPCVQRSTATAAARSTQAAAGTSARVSPLPPPTLTSGPSFPIHPHPRPRLILILTQPLPPSLPTASVAPGVPRLSCARKWTNAALPCSVPTMLLTWRS